ncbi:hypothetical protein V499_00824 [Pseudogymnoascus sp. VKM F-103]|nr:hypothetical protein V499_00824 [Pseudogymnoascus sp. VKM F-103]
MTTRLPHWDSSRLSNVLQQEFKAYLNTTAHITIWRHAAIAISRKHLGGAKFKRDYGSEPAPTWVAEQTGHTAYVAGNVYARGIEEAPGHVASARAEYRALSRSWHSFLGFGVYLGILPPNSLKRPREDSREGLKEHDQAGHLREAVNIEAEVQRRAKLELLKTNPYESPIIVLSVGLKDDNPVLFHVHKEKLTHIPFFKAVFRENAFAKGHQVEVNFEDGDPILFRRVVEFIYEGDYFPHRYLIEDLVEMSFRKLKSFHIGTKELTALAEHIVRSIPETRAAMAGQVLISDGTVDSRNMMCAEYVLDGPTLAFPASSFKLLAEASFTAKGHHEAREPHIGRDGNWRGEVDVIQDSGKERVIWDDHCHHAVGVVTGPYGRAVSAGWDFVYEVG